MRSLRVLLSAPRTASCCRESTAGLYPLGLPGSPSLVHSHHDVSLVAQPTGPHQGHPTLGYLLPGTPLLMRKCPALGVSVRGGDSRACWRPRSLLQPAGPLAWGGEAALLRSHSPLVAGPSLVPSTAAWPLLLCGASPREGAVCCPLQRLGHGHSHGHSPLSAVPAGDMALHSSPEPPDPSRTPQPGLPPSCLQPKKCLPAPPTWDS